MEKHIESLPKGLILSYLSNYIIDARERHRCDFFWQLTKEQTSFKAKVLEDAWYIVHDAFNAELDKERKEKEEK